MSTLVESGVLSGLLQWPETADDVWGSGIVPDHFSGIYHIPACALYRGWQEARATDPAGLVLLLTEMGELRRFGADAVFTLYQEAQMMSRASHRDLIAKLEEQRQRRKAIELATRVIQTAQNETSSFHLEISDLASEMSVAVQARITNPMAETLSVSELMSADFPQAEWAIEGLIRMGSRAVFTGPEGFGKSEFLYQIAVGAGLGIHPFHESPIKSAKVLILDAENEMGQLRGRISRIMGAFRHGDRQPTMQIQSALGWDLLEPRDAGQLLSMVRTYMPDLLIITPIYKIINADQNEAETVRKFMRVMDECRRISGCAIIMEAHANHAFQGRRDWRPSGSAFWLRWPEFGIGLDPVEGAGKKRMNLVRWRGDRVASNWPEQITWGSRLPWDGIDVIGQ